MDDQIKLTGIDLARTPPGTDSLNRALQIILSGNGNDLFTAFRHAVTSDSTSAALSQLMKHCERLMAQSPGVAIYLMGRIQPLAGKQKLHELYDAVEIWARECRDEESAATLSVLARESGPSRNRHVMGWIRAVKTSACDQ